MPICDLLVISRKRSQNEFFAILHYLSLLDFHELVKSEKQRVNTTFIYGNTETLPIYLTNINNKIVDVDFIFRRFLNKRIIHISILYVLVIIIIEKKIFTN